jgi:hypothetical protein
MPTQRQLFHKRQILIAVLWPSLLTAGCATVGFFTLFDPWSLVVPAPLDSLSRTGAYSVGFFIFWAITTVSSYFSCYFYRTNISGKIR